MENPLNNTKNSPNYTKRLLVSVSLLLALFSGLLCLAQQQEIKLSVAPEIFERTVERGDEFSEKIKIRNNSNIPLPMEVLTTNFGSQEESGTITFYEEPAAQRETPLDSEHLTGQGEDDISYNPRKWITIENPNFILDPDETEEIRMKVTIPEDAEPGGHYAVILFEPKLPSFYFEEGTVKTIPKVGVLFLFSVEVKGIKRSEELLTIAEFNIPENFHLKRLENLLGSINEALAAKSEEFSIVETSHLPFTLRIKNNDIYHSKIEGKLVISKSNGKIVGETEIKETTILPHRIRKFPVEFKPNLPEKINEFLPASISNFISQNFLFGKYQAHLVLTNGDPEGMSSTSYGAGAIIVKDIEFWVFPWKFYFCTGLIVLLILIFVVKYRKRIKSAFLILFRKS
jgi:hypothetical protein